MDSSVKSELDKLRLLDNCFPTPETWVKFRGRVGDSRCLVIAMADCNISHGKAFEAILKVTGAQKGRIGSGWNDDPGRTFEDVKNAIHNAISLMENENGSA